LSTKSSTAKVQKAVSYTAVVVVVVAAAAKFVFCLTQPFVRNHSRLYWDPG